MPERLIMKLQKEGKLAKQKGSFTQVEALLRAALMDLKEAGKIASVADRATYIMAYMAMLMKKKPDISRLESLRKELGFKDPGVKSRDMKRAFELLVLAGIIHPVYATSASGLPLGVQIPDLVRAIKE